ncbi:MAG: lysoplasmalogenase [Gammaproteobacteria bacterium]|nr:lysoplasmalogenase [Gammaproteobacteria bacterium]
MLIYSLFLLSFLLLIALLLSVRAEMLDDSGKSIIKVWATKPALSLMFIAVALMHATPWSAYSLLLLAGLCLCFLGDVFLIPNNARCFMLGLISFLAGHLFYIAAFAVLFTPDQTLFLAVLVLIGIDTIVAIWLKDRLQDMRNPVYVYMAAISVMVLAACGVFANDNLASAGKWLVLLGAISFYISDLFVVRQKFVSSSVFNPMMGLPLYYGGQFALALSLGHL